MNELRSWGSLQKPLRDHIFFSAGKQIWLVLLTLGKIVSTLPGFDIGRIGIVLILS